MTPTRRSGTLSSAIEVEDAGGSDDGAAVAGGLRGGAGEIVEGWALMAVGDEAGDVRGIAGDGQLARGLLGGGGRKFGKSFVAATAAGSRDGVVCAVGAAGSGVWLPTWTFGLLAPDSTAVGAEWNLSRHCRTAAATCARTAFSSWNFTSRFVG